jgi:AraC family L-rhamnose operon transcriptional activator RhaR
MPRPTAANYSPTNDARPAARSGDIEIDELQRQRFFDLDRLHLSVRLGSYRADMMYWGMLGERWWRNYQHAHSFFEVCYAFAGQGTFRVLGQEIPVKAGDVFLAKPEETHEIISSRTKPLGIYFWAFTLVRQPDHQANDIDRSVDQLLDALARATRHVTPASTPTFERTLLLLNDEIARKPPGYTQSIRGLTIKLLLDSARAVTDGVQAEVVEAAIRSTSRAVVQTAIRYLRDNLSRPLEVRDVAAQVHLSERHVSRLFHRETGQSILEYLTALRVEMASQLLLDQDLSIKQVARAVGYPDPHYFTTLFGRRTGMTPALFRKRRGTKFTDEARRPPPRVDAD